MFLAKSTLKNWWKIHLFSSANKLQRIKILMSILIQTFKHKNYDIENFYMFHYIKNILLAWRSGLAIMGP